MEAGIVRDILNKYELLSGQMVNYNKSDSVFSPNTGAEERVRVCDCLDVQEKAKPGKYLGMPMSIGKSKTEVFGFLSDKIQHKLQSWCNKELSKAGKLTLIKSSAQTTPNFWMSLFLIPETVCNDIERKMNAFLWGGANGKGVKWLSWKRLCAPKDFGGLGLKELKKFNMAMIAKQGWRLLTEANKLVSAVMKARYYSDSSVLNVKLGSNPSYVWRGIYQALEVVRAGARRKIGDGEDTMVWKVPWLPDDSHGFIATDEYPQLKNIKVSSLMSADKRWDVDLLNDLFCDRDVDLITRIPIPLRDTRDSWYWLLVEKGEFTVRSSYRWLHGECTDSYTALWKKLWHLQLPNKISNLVWRLCKGCLPTAMALASKHVDIDVRCPWCHSEIETDVHIMFLCDFARTVWLTTRVNHLVQCTMNESPCQIFTRAFENGTREQCVEIAMICWSLWNRRNRWVWERINGLVFGVRHSAINFLAE